jgi:hypothetical protein
VVRRRVAKEIGTALGIIVILAVVILVNGYMRRGSLSEQMEQVRRQAEASQQDLGVSIFSWDLLRKTTGTRRAGPTFDKQLAEHNDKPVSLVGFMVNMYELRAMKEFLLLPLPIECYFCQAPPMRDVVLVQMAEDRTADLMREPVLIEGDLKLNEGPGTKFFYVIKNAEVGAGKRGGKLHRKTITQEHVMHAVGAKQAEEEQKQKLLEGQEPPMAAPESPAPAPGTAPPAPPPRAAP